MKIVSFNRTFEITQQKKSLQNRKMKRSYNAILVRTCEQKKISV